MPRRPKDEALQAIADQLDRDQDQIFQANDNDVTAARGAGTASGLLDRLTLTPDRLDDVARAVRDVAELPDPVGEVVRGTTLPNGLQLRQVRVPLGVVGVIYEARPNVTVDAAAIGLKAGNAVLLRGSSSARSTNEALVAAMRRALTTAGLPADAVQLVPGVTHEAAKHLMSARGLVDVLIPRGGTDLIRSVVEESIVPVIETGVGNCHVYVDASADLDMAARIVINAKCQRPSVCNAAETLLVHEAVAGTFLPRVLSDLHAHRVTVHGDSAVGRYCADSDVDFVPVTDEDWACEYYSLDLAVGVVASFEDAVDHIRRWSSGHTECIVTKDVTAAQRFTAEVDSAAIMVNASTRFTDGGQFGFGAEIGISTQKLHARGPMGLAELTSTKYVVVGDGHVRE